MSKKTTNEAEEIVKNICNLFGVNPADINIDSFSNVTKNKDGVETTEVELSATVDDGEDKSESNTNINKKVAEKIEKLQNVIKEKGIDTKVKEILKDTQDRGLGVASAIGSFLTSLGEAIEDEVEKRSMPKEERTEVDDVCVDDEDCEEYGCCEDCPDCPYDCEHDEDCEEDEKKDEEQIVPRNAEQIRAKLKASSDVKFNKFKENVRDMFTGFIRYSIDRENYKPTTLNLDEDDAGIFIVMSFGELCDLMQQSYDAADCKKEIPLDELMELLREGTEAAAQKLEFDDCDVEFLLGEFSKKTPRSVNTVKVTLWF